MFTSDAFAQATGAASSANPLVGSLLQFGFIVPMFIIMYVLLIRPQQQQRKRTEELQRGLKKGDRVVTVGGIFGTVLGIDDAKVVLKIADDTKVEFTRSSVVQVLDGGSPDRSADRKPIADKKTNAKRELQEQKS